MKNLYTDGNAEFNKIIINNRKKRRNVSGVFYERQTRDTNNNW